MNTKNGNLKIKKNNLKISKNDILNDFINKNSSLKDRKNSSIYLRTLSKINSNAPLRLNLKANKIKLNITKLIARNNNKYRNGTRDSSSSYILKTLNYGKSPIRNNNYGNLTLITGYNNKINKVRKELPKQELTDSTFEKKLELSKIIAKINENKEKVKISHKNLNVDNCRNLSNKLKLKRNKSQLTNKYNKNGLIFSYLNKDDCPFHLYGGHKTNDLNFHNISFSKNKIEKIKQYFSNKKSRNGVKNLWVENTLDKITQMKTELKYIKFNHKTQN